jgi:hypothetical protein
MEVRSPVAVFPFKGLVILCNRITVKSRFYLLFFLGKKSVYMLGHVKHHHATTIK